MKNGRNKIAIIIGAGPAGLTAAYELLKKTADIKPIIYEASDFFGGLATTVNYKGNRMDMGGHRFFSKSDRVMQWWFDVLPLQGMEASGSGTAHIGYQNKERAVPVSSSGPDPAKVEKVMLIRKRLSRIFYLGKFFDYPVALNRTTIANLGITRIVRIGASYMRARLFPIRPERSLEDFFINRFGKELYLTFFKEYTEKVWGVPCTDIAPEWGAQRIKGLSLRKALGNVLSQALSSKHALAEKNRETSLVQQFLYPKYGPGQMWEEVARMVQEQGAEIHLNHQVVGLTVSQNAITGVTVKNGIMGEVKTQSGDYVFSTMPVRELIESMQPAAPQEVLRVSRGLAYRDFIIVGLLLKHMRIQHTKDRNPPVGIIPDNWMYIQEPGVKMGRLEIFNNWSPYLVKDPATAWVGLEYFCNEGDALWSKPDKEFIAFAVEELAKIGIIEKEDVLDGTIVRVKKAYPAYFGTYGEFAVIRKFTDAIENLFLIGRNGMHKYNNQDHSMLTAMAAVEHIIQGIKTKDAIWDVNAEQDYHEAK